MNTVPITKAHESQDTYKRNAQYFRVYNYLKNLYETGVLSRAQTRKALRYFADYFDAPMRLFL